MVFELVTLSHYTANINLGRIAALLAYCYRLCRTYVDTYLGSKSLLTFLGMIAGWLFKVFLRTRVYDWLDKQGGWVRMCTNTRKNERETEREERERERGSAYLLLVPNVKIVRWCAVA